MKRTISAWLRFSPPGAIASSGRVGDRRGLPVQADRDGEDGDEDGDEAGERLAQRERRLPRLPGQRRERTASGSRGARGSPASNSSSAASCAPRRTAARTIGRRAAPARVHDDGGSAEHAVGGRLGPLNVADIVERDFLDACAGHAEQTEVGEHVPLAGDPRRQPPWAAAPEQPFPRQQAVHDDFLKSTFGTCLASGGTSKKGYSLKPNIFAVTLAGKLPARGVVLLHALVVAHALDREAVLGAGELVHQAVELLVGLQLRIVLDHRQQPAERRGLLVRRGDRFFRRLRREQPRSRVGDVLVDALFVLREALDGLDEIRNQVVAPLQLVFDLRPLRLDRFFLLDERVVGTAGRAAARSSGEPRASLQSEFFACMSHVSILPTGAAAASATPAAAEAAEAAAESAAAAAETAEAATEAAAERPDAARPSARRRPRSAGAAAARRRRCG